MYVDDEPQGADTTDDPREQELLWPARQHPDELILPDAHPTRFPGKWIAVYEDFIPADQRNALTVNGYIVYRIQLLEGRKAQVVIREEPRPDRDGELAHPPTDLRYKQYDPRSPREYLDTTSGDRE